MRIESDIKKTAAVLGVLGIAFLAAAWMPQRSERQELEARVEKGRKQLGVDRKGAQGLDEMRAQVADLAQQAHLSNKIVPPANELGDLLRRLTSELNTQDMRDQEVQAEAIVEGPEFNVIPLVLRFEGSYAGTFAFVRSIESMSRLTRVNHLEIAGVPTKPGELVKVRLELTTFSTGGKGTAMNDSMQKFIKRITANRKQFGAMVALLAVALLMWGRLMLKDTPRTAVADPTTKAPAVETPAPASATRKHVVVELPDQSPRDLFTLNATDFTKVEKPNVIPTPNSVPEKSDEAKRAEMSAKLKDVKLQSTIMGERPAALIDNRLFHVGSEPVAGFTVTRITQHSVFLKRADAEEEFELRMYRD